MMHYFCSKKFLIENTMEITGKIIQKLAPQSGTSKAGNAWKKQEYVLETFDSYPKKVKFDFFGERADQYPLEVGDTITLSYDIESREFNQRWYTDIRGWKAEKADPNAQPAAGSQPSPTVPASGPAPAPETPTSFEGGGGTDDLPF